MKRLTLKETADLFGLLVGIVKQENKAARRRNDPLSLPYPVRFPAQDWIMKHAEHPAIIKASKIYNHVYPLPR